MEEYLGASETTMIEFLVDMMLNSRSAPEAIISELEAVLDEDARPFVVRLWRFFLSAIARI